MEEFLIFVAVIVGLCFPVGAIMGIVAFARAGRALRQVEALQRQLTLLRAGAAGEATSPLPAAMPPLSPTEQPQTPPPPIAPPLPEWTRMAPPAPPVTPFGPPLAPPLAPPAPPEPRPVRAPQLPPPPRKRIDVEELLTLKWGVWLGGAALLLAGVFLIRYAADEGLLGPATRCALAALLGGALIAAAEWLRGRGEPLTHLPFPDQAPPALAAGGVAVLFGAAYGFGVYYAFVPMFAAFVMLAVASFFGLMLSLRYGQLVAAIGIVGAFATPVLATTGEGSVPGLFGYLFVVTAVALAVVRFRAWVWLGWATTIAGAIWVLLAVYANAADAWAPGLFVAATAALNLFLLPRAALEWPIGRKLVWVPYATLGCSGLVLYLAHPGWAVRIGVLLLIPLAIWKGAREQVLDKLPWLSVGFFLATLLFWALPAWQPTGEIISAENMIQAILPGGWAPDVIQPLLFTAILIAALYAATGLWQERAAPRPLIWAALGAAVPVLTFIVTYGQVALFQGRPIWAVCAGALAAAATAAADAARRENFASPKQRAGIHATAAVAFIALGYAIILDEQWLTVALALLLPALAIIEEKAELPALRKLALIVAGLVLIRLLLNWYIIDYALGDWPIVNLLLLTYGVPALCFAYAAQHFRRRGDDLTVAVLESGAAAFATVLVALEIRHWAHNGVLARPGTSFLECALHVCSLGILALMTMRGAARLQRPVLNWVWRIQGGLALLGGVLLILVNPIIGDARIHGLPILNELLLAYVVPAILAALAMRHELLRNDEGVRKLLGVYALVAVFTWITVEIRYAFHPGNMNFIFVRVLDAELWAWSGGWLVYGIALMIGGIRFRVKSLRLAALAVIGFTALKIFVVDMAGLTGLWRVLSFLGLGLTLIGLGAVFRRFVAGVDQTKDATPP